MGRNYYCEYCDKTMKNVLNVRKRHIEGLPHTIAKANYLQLFKDPQQILNEEIVKYPCERFLNGKECRFGFICNFSHYTQKQLDGLKRIIIKSEDKRQQNQQIVKENLRNNSTENLNNNLNIVSVLPSLQPLILEKALSSDLLQWGI